MGRVWLRADTAGGNDATKGEGGEGVVCGLSWRQHVTRLPHPIASVAPPAAPPIAGWAAGWIAAPQALSAPRSAEARGPAMPQRRPRLRFSPRAVAQRVGPRDLAHRGLGLGCASGSAGSLGVAGRWSATLPTLPGATLRIGHSDSAADA